MKYFSFSANPLPAGIITADGQQQNVMVYTTSYQQVRMLTCSLCPKTSDMIFHLLPTSNQVSFILNEDSTLFKHFEWCFYLRCRSRACNSSSSPEDVLQCHLQKSTPNLHKSSLYTSTYKWRSWTVGSVWLVFSGPSSSALTGHRAGLLCLACFHVCSVCFCAHTLWFLVTSLLGVCFVCFTSHIWSFKGFGV